MTDVIEFNKVLKEWSERFISRSMRNYMRFVKASGLSLSHFSILMHLYYRGPNDISEKAIEFRNQWIESLHVTLSEKQLETISASLRDLVTAEHDLDRQ